MHPNHALLIVVHVHENEFELSRLLRSIAENASLSVSTVLVMNNAPGIDIARRISDTCNSYPNISLEVNQFNWPIIRSSIASYLDENFGNSNSGWLNKLELGLSGWNVNLSRNIGMLIARLCYPDKKYVLNFDSDIVVPAALEVVCPIHPKLTCLRIIDCPDLSRLEWITFYLLFLGKKYDIPFPYFKDQYCYKLITELSTETLASIIYTYSSFELEKNEMLQADSVVFSTREEYYGACYFISAGELGKCSYPSWYDNDWFFFKEMRNGEEEVEFIDQFVLHTSARKDIQDEESLHFEEDGQIINIVYEYTHHHAYSGPGALDLAINRRKGIINEVLQLAYLLMRAPVSRQESLNLQAIVPQLKNLLSHIDELSGTDVFGKIKEYDSYQAKWQDAFKRIAIDTNTANLLQVFHNLCET